MSRRHPKGTCKDCQQYRRMEGRGLCQRCHRQRTHAGTLHEMPMLQQQTPRGQVKVPVECPRCERTRLLYARGVCESCYRTAWRSGDRAPGVVDPEYLLGEVEHLLVWCGLPARDIPRRVGMTFSGFEKAMQRARAAGDARAEGWFVAHRRAA